MNTEALRYAAVSSVRGSALPSNVMDPQKGKPKENKTEHLIADRQEGIGVCGWILVYFSFLLVLITFPISIWACVNVIREYERAVVSCLGLILSKKAKGPGVILILPCTDTFVKVDLIAVTCNIPPQENLTKDAVTTQANLRNVLGTQTLAQLLAGCEEISCSIQLILNNATEQWGIKVAHVEIKDVRIPVAMQRAMAAKAEAARETRAKVAATEGEMNASKALKQASMVLAESPASLQLCYLQILTTLAAKNNSTIVFPLPINMLVSLGQKSKGG
ncbi:stomatin-like protein 3 [Amazona aestiva]|uniref:Stomatin-like protein 3 n=1 Tax=Amazona aestiva TaxID=12930 RepID=A0A0Q3P4R7_AMAAE|nr:stomatin-like protein 3 [Amazona aestiva]